MGKSVSIDQSHEVMAVLGTNVDWSALDSDVLQREVIKDPTGSGQRFTGFLRNGGRLVFPPTPEQTATEIVKVVTIQIGGGRTTDQMVEAARKDGFIVNPNINQKNMPAAFGPMRFVTLEFRQFDHNPNIVEVVSWQNEPGHVSSGYVDGLSFREYDTEAQYNHSHVFVPETPWWGEDGIPYALNLWTGTGGRTIGLFDCLPRRQWGRDTLFARRKYLVTSVA